MRAILSFHSVDESESVLSITPLQLESLVDAIRSSGHEIVALRTLLEDSTTSSPESIAAKANVENQVALTFDDGMHSLWENAMPVLRDRDAPATLFLTTSRLGRDNRWPSYPAEAPTMPMMSWSQAGELRDAGWSIQAHTASHPDLRTQSDTEIRDEMELGNRDIEDNLGYRPDVFAYPYGHFDRRVESAASEIYRYAVTTEMGRLPVRIDAPHRIPRIETYYFRSTAVHQRFGTIPFLAYLMGRTVLRNLRSRG